MFVTDMAPERNALMQHVYPQLKEFCRKEYRLEFQVRTLAVFGTVLLGALERENSVRSRQRNLSACFKIQREITKTFESGKHVNVSVTSKRNGLIFVKLL